jgi:hypothetical protein
MLLKVTFLLLILFSTAIIAYQDFKTREISLWAVCLFIATVVLEIFFTEGKYVLLVNTVSTLFFILLWVLISTLVFYLKEKKLSAIIDKKLGMGDILLLFGIGVALDLVSLIIFTTVAAILALVFSYRLIKQNKTIPFGVNAMIIFSVF